MGWFRVGLTVVVLAIVTLVLWPVQALAMRFDWPVARRLPWYWQRIACRVAGFRVTVEGQPAAPPLLIAANHVSWMDISVLGSVLPVSFIAKSEVSGWPVVRTLSRLQRSVYIERQKRAKTGAAAEAIASRVSRGDVMVLFAEGTTGDGARVLPFRSALLGAARAAAAAAGAVTVQPVAITYLRIHGLPMTFSDRPAVAWYGDMGIEDNFVKAVGWGSIEATVSFGEPIAFGPDADRKAVAEQCHAAVRAMVADVRRRAFLAPPGRGQRFPARAKEAKGTADLPAGASTAARGDEMTSRVS
jgi:1-acyl-sn-glycerol-3-phosphate acyltransferase